jgi:phage shock protein C
MKTLYRSRNQKVIGGVAGGIAEYFDIDPVFIRVLFVVSVFASGVGLIAYIILWIITPQEPFERIYQNYNKQKDENNTSQANESENFDNSAKEYVPNFSFANEEVKNDESKGKLKIFGGMLLVFLGLVILLDEIVPEFDFTYIWSSLLILLGIYIIFSRPKRKQINE